MAITKDQKQAQVQALTSKLGDAQSVIFAHYIGMSVAESGELRGQLKEANAEMKVAKKTLIKIAAKEAGLPEVQDSDMEGPVSLLLSYDDPLSGAQVAFKFGKDHEQVKIIGGIFDGKVLTKEQAIELAKMPSKPELLAKFVGMVQSPLTSFAALSSSPLSSFARAMSQLADQGGLNPEAEAPAEEKVEEPTKEEATEDSDADSGTEDAKPETETEPEAETAENDSTDAAEPSDDAPAEAADAADASESAEADSAESADASDAESEEASEDAEKTDS